MVGVECQQGASSMKALDSAGASAGLDTMAEDLDQETVFKLRCACHSKCDPNPLLHDMSGFQKNPKMFENCSRWLLGRSRMDQTHLENTFNESSGILLEVTFDWSQSQVAPEPPTDHQRMWDNVKKVIGPLLPMKIWKTLQVVFKVASSGFPPPQKTILLFSKLKTKNPTNHKNEKKTRRAMIAIHLSLNYRKQFKLKNTWINQWVILM